MAIPIVHHPAYAIELPLGHRFPMRKFSTLAACLGARGLLGLANSFTPEPATAETLSLAHDEAWVEKVLRQRATAAEERVLGFPVTPALAERSRAAVGGTIMAARLALAHGIACNAAGGSHHAFRTHGAGFCVFNDVATAALLLLREGAVGKVLVVDLDVHQGDGTASILAEEPRVTTLSVHGRTNFPHHKAQSDIDVALDDGIADREYLDLIEALLPSLLARERPDLVFYNAGVDPHAKDRLGRMALTDAGLAARERLVIDTCRDAGIPLACVLGGGYDTDIEALAARHAILFETAASLHARSASIVR